MGIPDLPRWLHAWCPKSTKNMGLFGGGLKNLRVLSCYVGMGQVTYAFTIWLAKKKKKKKTSSYTSSDFAYRLGTGVLTHGTMVMMEQYADLTWNNV